MEVGLYVISYNRWNEINTYKFVPTSTYVVRKSQEENYKKAGIKKIWAVEDDLIDSWVNVMNYVVENAKENNIVIMDDDIIGFSYVHKIADWIEDTEIIRDELERISTIIYDLELGHGLFNFTPDARKYSQEFAFHGTGGSVYFFNREKVKSKFFNEAYAVADAEFQLQELLENRIVIYPQYITSKSNYNQGSNTQKRTLQKVNDSILWTKRKWGKYFDVNEKWKTKIKIKR
ncbi:MAG: hypothetical protein KC589_09340 [Nanoarchaeota archaeon]|nr:hypothetical protein [Nanoarchaeota archaeon]